MRWNFQRGSDKSYRLVISDDDSWGTFDAHLLKLGEHYFLDLFPVEWDASINEFQRAHLLPVHSFLAGRNLRPQLEFAAMDGKWLKDYLAEHRPGCKGYGKRRGNDAKARGIVFPVRVDHPDAR